MSKFDEADWQKKLTPAQYEILRLRGTEAPFTGKYLDHHEKGVYACAACGNSLFNSETKFDSDIDLVVFSPKKTLNLESFERKMKRKMQIFWFDSFKDVKPKELANNIINGYVLNGKIVI